MSPSSTRVRLVLVKNTFAFCVQTTTKRGFCLNSVGCSPTSVVSAVGFGRPVPLWVKTIHGQRIGGRNSFVIRISVRQIRRIVNQRTVK